jgi:subtilisin family serine protease
VYFRDKGTSSHVLARQQALVLPSRVRQRRQKVGLSGPTWYDIPVNESYVQAVVSAGADLWNRSKWLNAISVSATPEQRDQIRGLPFVKAVEPVRVYRQPLPKKGQTPPRAAKSLQSQLDYGYAQEQIAQIHVDQAHDAGFFGQGVRVLIMDTGFYTPHEAFDSLTIIAQYDFINRDTVVMNEAGQDSIDQHDHGTFTFSTLGANVPGKLIGPAFKAEFLLAKTERVHEEIQQEEDDYVAGLEWGESLGADVVSTSLGYLDWYTFQDMDGNTAVTTKAVDIAVGLGMVCVTAAGNENNSPWKHIIAPADADSVIAVGAVDRNGSIAVFSSRGPSYDGRIKPEVCARGVQTACAAPGGKGGYAAVSGTSLSTPLVAGAAAVLLSAHPDWTPMMVREALMMTASQWLRPNNTYGWGIANLWAAINYDAFTTGVEDEPFTPDEFAISKTYPNPFNSAVTITVNVGRSTESSLDIFNILGQPVVTLYHGSLESGNHLFTWEASGHPSGIYFVRFSWDGKSEMKKITYLK